MYAIYFMIVGSHQVQERKEVFALYPGDLNVSDKSGDGEEQINAVNYSGL